MPVVLDLVVRNGRIIDGTGGAPRQADVGVRDGRIVAVGVVDERGRQEIDAADLVVTPGFIDLHTHYDAQAFWDPTLSPSSLHGVTTVMGGNCGFSLAPLTPASADYVMRMLARTEGMPQESLKAGVPWDWTSTEDFLGRFVGKVSLNTGWLVGHSTLRCAVMGEDAVGGTPTAEQLGAMKDLLREGLRAGALGFSSSLASTHNDHNGAPVPSRWASGDELIALSAVVGEFPGTSLEFIPAVGRFDQPTFDLVAAMTAAARRPLNWNALVVEGQTDEYVAHQLSLADFAAARGGRVVALTPPMPRHNRINFRTGFVLDALPGWGSFFTKSLAERLADLKDPAVRGGLEAMARGTQGGLTQYARWSDYIIMETYSAQNEGVVGVSVGQIAQRRGLSPFDALAEVLVADELRTVIMLEDRYDNTETWERRAALWRDDRALLGASDAGAHLDMTDAFSYSTTMLEKAVRERGLLPLEEAIAMLTSRPAALYGLVDRGVVAEGAWADLVVLDPDRVGALPVSTRFDLPAGAGRIFGGASGIEHVIVAGVEVVRGAESTDARPGQVLRSGVDTATVDTSLSPAR